MLIRKRPENIYNWVGQCIATGLTSPYMALIDLTKAHDAMKKIVTLRKIDSFTRCVELYIWQYTVEGKKR